MDHTETLDDYKDMRADICFFDVLGIPVSINHDHTCSMVFDAYFFGKSKPEMRFINEFAVSSESGFLTSALTTNGLNAALSNNPDVMRAFDNEHYTVKRIDGRLKAIGPVDMVKEDTGLFTVALAPVVRLGDDYGDEEFGLFRAFPGRPEIHPFTRGLKEGDVISGSEVNARRLQPVAPDTGA